MYTGNDRGNEGDAHQLVWEHMGTILPIGRFPIFYFQSLLMENNSARSQQERRPRRSISTGIFWTMMAVLMDRVFLKQTQFGFIYF